jgi:hypothetical protein
MTQRIIDLVLSVLASIAALFLSWPFWRDYGYWAESHTAWPLYFVAGFILAIFVFYVFIDSLHILFLHDSQEKATVSTTNDIGNNLFDKDERS